MKYSYWKWDKIIPKEYCELIVSNVDWNAQHTAKIIGKVTEKQLLKKRKTEVVWEPKASVVSCIAEKYVHLANQAAGWNFNLTEIEHVQMGKYHSGGFYTWHTDDSALAENPRKLSFVLLLNNPTEYEGGVFQFEKLKEQPVLEQGSILVFPSFLRHRVTPVTAGIRYSAVTWMRGPAFK